MVRNILILAALVALGGCTQNVQPEAKLVPQPYAVPVPFKAAAPATLAQPMKVQLNDLPSFIAPSDKTATSCLAPEGERRLRDLVDGLLTRDKAWRTWAATPPPTGATVMPPAAATMAPP